MSEVNESSVSPLNERAASALAAYGAHTGLSPEVKTALRARISASVAAQTPARIDAAPAIDVRRSAVRVGVALAAAAALLLAIRFVARDGDDAVRGDAEGAPQAAYGAHDDDAGGEVRTRSPRADAPGRDQGPKAMAPAHDADAPEPAPLEALDPDTTSGARETPRDLAPTPAPTTSKPRRKPATEDEAPTNEPRPAAVDTTLAAELELMRSARAALRRDDPEAALRHLSRHASTFPGGQLLEDREALRVQALCDAGRVDDARKAAQAFANAHPASLHVGRVKTICEEKRSPP